MANPNRGEVSFDVEGVTYTLRFSYNALCELEQATGLGIVRFQTELLNPENFRLSMLRAAIWAGLRERHPTITLAQTGELILKAGGAVQMVALLVDALRAAFPPEDSADRPLLPADQNSGRPTGPIN